MYKVDEIFLIHADDDDTRTEVGTDPDNSDFIKITSSTGSYQESLTMCKERAIKVAEAIIKLTEMR